MLGWSCEAAGTASACTSASTVPALHQRRPANRSYGPGREKKNFEIGRLLSQPESSRFSIFVLSHAWPHRSHLSLLFHLHTFTHPPHPPFLACSISHLGYLCVLLAILLFPPPHLLHTSQQPHHGYPPHFSLRPRGPPGRRPDPRRPGGQLPRCCRKCFPSPALSQWLRKPHAPTRSDRSHTHGREGSITPRPVPRPTTQSFCPESDMQMLQSGARSRCRRRCPVSPS